MSSPITVVPGTWITPEIYEARCIDCNASLGTFNPDTLRHAVVNNINRGGLKCPTCRMVSCVFCGGKPYGDRSIVILSDAGLEYGQPDKEYFCCALCTYEFYPQIKEEFPLSTLV